MGIILYALSIHDREDGAKMKEHIMKRTSPKKVNSKLKFKRDVY